MIVSTMSLDEVIKEFGKDEDCIHAKWIHLRDKFGSLCKKRTRFPFSQRVEYITPVGHNKVYFIFRAYKRSDWKKVYTQTFCVYDRPEGKYAVIYTAQKTLSVIIPPHFFARYRERFMNNDTSIKTEDLMMNFFLNNHRCITLPLPPHMKENGAIETDERYDIGIKLDEGCAFGSFYRNGYILYRTIIRDDMLHDDQKGFFDMLETAKKAYEGKQLTYGDAEIIPMPSF